MILLLFILFNLSNSIYLYSYDKSTVSVNNQTYRESLKSNYFVFNKKYNLDLPYKYKVNKIEIEKDFYGTNLLYDYLIKNPKTIGNINYFYYKHHTFNFILNLVSSDLLHVKIIHNNETIYKDFNNIISIYKSIKLQTGYHNFDLILYNDKYSCNCPSINKGYTNTRFFYGFININKKRIIDFMPTAIS